MLLICYLRLMSKKSLQYIIVGVLVCFLQVFVVKGQQTSADVLQQKKPYSISTSIRQGYDDNIYTSHTDQQASMTTGIWPSFLINYPMDQTLLSAPDTFDADS